MIRIFPNFFTEQELSNILGTLDTSCLIDVPNSPNVKSCQSRIFRVKPKVSVFGEILYQELLIYETGSYSSIHIDSGYNGSKPWVYTGILFCNDDYDGGVFKFDNLNIEMKPPKNTLLVFPAGDHDIYSHGVTQITGGTRITAIFRFGENHE